MIAFAGVKPIPSLLLPQGDPFRKDIGCVYRVVIRWYNGEKGRWRDWNWISSPEGQGVAATQRIRHAGRLRRGGGGCVHSIRQEGAALRSVVSSTARTTVHGAGGSEDSAE